MLLTIGNQVDKRLLVWDLHSACLVSSISILPATRTISAWGGNVRDVKKKATALYQFATASNQSILLWQVDPSTGALKYQKVCMLLFQMQHCRLIVEI